MTRTMYSLPLDLSILGSESLPFSVSSSWAMMRSSSALDLHSPMAFTKLSSSPNSLGALRF
jgi:hypothetical protein